MEDNRLSELCDKQDITEVLYLYGRGWDRTDEKALRACFHEDSVHAHGDFKGLSQDFVTRGLERTKASTSQSHMIFNPLIEIREDKAVSECSFLAHHRRPSRSGPGEEDMFLKGRYLDIFERRDGVWKIANRTALHDFERIRPPADKRMADSPPDQLGQNKPADPLYAMLDSLA